VADGRLTAPIFSYRIEAGAEHLVATGEGSIKKPPRRKEEEHRGVADNEVQRRRVLWPNISYDDRAIVFERNFAVWKLDTTTGQASEVPSRERAPASLQLNT
jgi:hypothetical protein